MAERLVPTDEHGPGAVEAGALQYVVEALAGDYADSHPAYVAGLDALDAASTAAHGAPYADLAPDEQDALLREIDGSPFFELARRHVLEGMFGDPSYGGNRDRAGWALLGYGGPRPLWTEWEQRIHRLHAR